MYIIGLWLETHILLVCLTLGSIVGCIWIYLFRDRLMISIWCIPILSVLNTIIGLFCVKVFAGIENWDSPFSSGQSLYGGIFLLPIIYIVVAKLFRLKLYAVFDVFTMCTITTLLFARVACIFTGCCYGTFIPGSESIRWPTREIEILFYIVLIIALYKRNIHNSLPGGIWPIYMISYGIFRFFEEWIREEDQIIGIFHRGHIWSILSIIIGLSVYSELCNKNQKKEE